MSINRLSEFWPEWEIENLLGEGSYGRVYKAVKKSKNFSSYAAIKIISVPSNIAEFEALCSEGMSDAETKTYLEGIVDDFANEIKMMETLKGAPHIVAVEDYKILEKSDSVGWDIYIRMELLESFKDYSRRTPIDENEVLKLGVELATALEICRNEHIIHRDIKPANIFISRFNEYKIGDFGVAKELEKTTGAMSAKGTFSYMAPEVARGLRYDSTVDIYSLGIVMYTLLNNNRQPFIDPYATQISYNDRKTANDRRLSGKKLPPPCNASRELADIILCACEYDPKLRYRTPTEFKDALIRYKSNKSRTFPTPTKSVKLPESEISIVSDIKKKSDTTATTSNNITEPIAVRAKRIENNIQQKGTTVKLPESDISIVSDIKKKSDATATTSNNITETVTVRAKRIENNPFHDNNIQQKGTTEENEKRFIHNEVNNPTLIFETETDRKDNSFHWTSFVSFFMLAITVLIVIVAIANKINDDSTSNYYVSTDAYEESTGDPYADKDYSMEGTTLTIKAQNGFWQAWAEKHNVQKVIIESGITKIPSGAFDGFTSLEEISIPYSVTHIGERAFADCSSLRNVELPDTVTMIGEQAFTHCTALKAIGLPATLESLGRATFNSCESLNEITIPDSLTSLEDYAFFGCSSLTNVEIPSSVERIGDWTFARCTDMESITINSGTKSIGKWTFEGCNELYYVYLPDSVTEIDDTAFRYNDSMEIHNALIISNENSYARSYAKKNGLSYKNPS